MEKIELLKPYRLGKYELKNRVVMAPMTRNRAGEGNIPTDLNVLYYAQRASAGLIVTEATQISAQGIGYPDTPGIHTERQIEGWKKVTDAVHLNGGLIFIQLWHVGRISHPYFLGGGYPVAPSPIRPEGMTFTPEGMKEFLTPRELEIDEIADIVEQYRIASKNAIHAGFDGVEIHGANGYLIDQFLQDGSNKRKDKFGGSEENRARFALEVVEAVADAIGPDRVGIRISPGGIFNDMFDSNPESVFDYLVKELNKYNLAYLHVIEASSDLDPIIHAHYIHDITGHFRERFNGTLISNGNYNKESGISALANNRADLVSYGRLFISNPDLPKRFELDAPLAESDQSTFYGGDKKGYTDYPPFGEGVLGKAKTA